MKKFWGDIKSLFIKDKPSSIFAVVGLIIFLPLIIFAAIVGLAMTVVLSPFIFIVSLKYGSGNTYLARVKNNHVKVFEACFNHADAAI